jgi:hypothetical protein
MIITAALTQYVSSSDESAGSALLALVLSFFYLCFWSFFLSDDFQVLLFVSCDKSDCRFDNCRWLQLHRECRNGHRMKTKSGGWYRCEKKHGPGYCKEKRPSIQVRVTGK